MGICCCLLDPQTNSFGCAMLIDAAGRAAAKVTIRARIKNSVSCIAGAI